MITKIKFKNNKKMLVLGIIASMLLYQFIPLPSLIPTLGSDDVTEELAETETELELNHIFTDDDIENENEADTDAEVVDEETETDLSEYDPVVDMPVYVPTTPEEDETIIIESETGSEVVHVDEETMDQIIEDLENDQLAFIDGWVLFDSRGNRLPQSRNFQGAMRNIGPMSNAHYDLSHVHSVWTGPSRIQHFEAFINGRWVSAFCIQPGVPSITNPGGDPNPAPSPGWSQGFGGLTPSQQRAIMLILIHGYNNTHGVNASRQDAYIATQVLIWEAALGFWNVNTPWNGNASIPSGVQGDPWRRLIANSGQMVGGSNNRVIIAPGSPLGYFYPRPAIGNAQRMAVYNQIRTDIWTFHGQTPAASRRPSFAGVFDATSPLHALTWNQTNQRYEVTLNDANGLLGRFVNLSVGASSTFATGLRVTRTGANTLVVYAQSATNPPTGIHTSPASLLNIEPQQALPITFWVHETLQDKVVGNTSIDDPLRAFFRVEVEQRIRGGVEVQKDDNERNTNLPQGEGTLQGATIEIINRSGQPVDTLDGRQIADGAVVGTITTNVNGIARTPNNYLQAGIYELREISSPRGYLLNANWSSRVEITQNNTIVRTSVNLPQQIIRGGVEVEKVDRELTLLERLGSFTGLRPVQGDATLVGIRFDIRNVSTPTNGGDGSVIVNNQLFATGEVVASIFTDYEVRGGELRVFARTATNALPYGTFEIQEVATNQSYLLTDGETRTFMIRENGDLVVGTIDDDDLVFSNYVVRGDVEIEKHDIELDASEAMAGTSLEGIEFEIINESTNPVLVNGDVFENGEVIMSIFTYWCDEREAYIARTTGRTLPYGTYRITEVTGNRYYLLEEELNRPTLSFVFEIREDGQTVRYGVNGEEMIFRNQVRRSDLAGVKIAEGSARRLSHIPFAITNHASGETNVIISDQNGEFNTVHTWNPRRYANINNHLLEMEENDEPIMNSDVDIHGSVWFATGEFGTVAPVHNTLGALPYGWYRIREMRAENNIGFDLLEFDVFITRHGHVINLGTLTNINEPAPGCPFDPEDPSDPLHPDHPDSDTEWEDWPECPRPTPGSGSGARISTQAWIGEYGNQYFWWGDALYMTDTVRITLYNTQPGTQKRFNAMLHNRTAEGVTALVYTSDYIEFEIPYVEGWQTGVPILLEFDITTTIPIVTGEFEHDSEFFWSENLYELIDDDEWDLIYEHNPEGDDPNQTLFPRYATIATQAHTGNGTSQRFWQGDSIHAYDIIKITHGNIPNGTPMYYSIYLFAVPGHIDMDDVAEVKENKVLIWYDLYIPYTVENVIMTFEEMTNIDTSLWYGYTLFFAERLYTSDDDELNDDDRRLVYEHNKDGSDLFQRLTPVPRPTSEESEEPEASIPAIPTTPNRPRLPQTGTAAFNVMIGGIGVLSAGGTFVGIKMRQSKKSKRKVIKL